jgi:hypothetical protein
MLAPDAGRQSCHPSVSRRQRPDAAMTPDDRELLDELRRLSQAWALCG